MKRQLGLSLIELMVSIAISLLLVLGIVEILINSNQASRIQTNLQFLQQNGQFAMELLARDIRNTDFWGCVNSLGDVSNHLNSAGTNYNSSTMSFSTALQGAANVSGGSLVSGTDSITISAANNLSVSAGVLPTYGPTSSAPIQIATGNGISAGTIVIVSNCLQGDIFQVTNGDASSTGLLQHAAAASSPGNNTSFLSTVYTGDASVYLPYTHIYSIQTGATGLPSLFMQDSSGTQEMATGIEDLLILYGEDMNGDGVANRYVQANSVSNMDNVVSIRIYLVAISAEDNLTATAMAYIVNGQTLTPSDKRLRRVYSATIPLGNRG